MDLLNQILRTKETFRVPNFNEIVRGANDWVSRLDQFVNDFSLDDLNVHFDRLKDEMDNSLNKLREKISQLQQPNEVFVINYNRDTDTLATRMEGRTFIAEVQSLDGHTSAMHSFTTPQLEGFEGMPKREYDAVNHKMKFIFGNEEAEQAEAPQEEEGNEVNEAPTEAPQETEEVDERVATAIKLHNEGWSFRRIAKEVGVSDKTVARWVRKNQ